MMSGVDELLKKGRRGGGEDGGRGLGAVILTGLWRGSGAGPVQLQGELELGTGGDLAGFTC